MFIKNVRTTGLIFFNFKLCGKQVKFSKETVVLILNLVSYEVVLSN